MKKISSWYNRFHKVFQFRTTGGYDTYGSFRKSNGGKRIQHKKSRRLLEQEKFYEGFEEFIESQKDLLDKGESNE